MRVLVWMVLVLVIPARFAGAQSEAESASTPLPPVEVRGQQVGAPERIRETSAFATAIDTREATARVESVADVLAENVGVQVRRFGGLGSFSTVSIRGSTPNQVEVYLDNVLLNQANAGLVDLGSLPLDNLERIEIYRGFAPLELGAGSIGGAVKLVTRQVAGETINAVSGSYGSFDTRKFTLYRSQNFERLGYLVLFNYTESDGDFKFWDDNATPFNPLDDKVSTRRNNDFRSFTVTTKGETALAGWAITLSDDLFAKDQGVPGQSSNQAQHARFDIWRNVATLRLQRRGFPWAATDVTFQVAHTWQREDFQDLANEIGTGVQDDENTSHTFSTQGLLNLYVEPWNQIVGVLLEGRYETFRSVTNLPDAEKRPRQHRTSLLLALQDEIRLFDERLALRPLVRYQFVNSDFGAPPTFGPVLLNTDRHEQNHLFTLSLGVRYQLVSFLALKGNVGRFERMPTLFELFGDRGTTLGNPALEPERSLNWDLGLVVELSRLGILNRVYLEYAYFANAADDLIVFVQNSQVTAKARNIGAADIRGHELSWSVTALDHVRVYGNYTFQDAEDTSDTFSRGNTLPGRPRHEVHQAFELFARLGKLVYEFDYLAKNFLDRANAFVVDQRMLHNVRLTVLPFGERLKLTFEVKNITDNQVEDFRGFPLPGRSFFGTIEGRF